MRKLWVLSLVFGLAMVVGCSKPPQEDIDAVNSSLEAARAAGAQDYASESLQSAEQAQQALNDELKAQDDKFFKSYTRAKELAAQAKTAADQAVQDANTGKEAMKQEVGTAIQNAGISWPRHPRGRARPRTWPPSPPTSTGSTPPSTRRRRPTMPSGTPRPRPRWRPRARR